MKISYRHQMTVDWDGIPIYILRGMVCKFLTSGQNVALHFLDSLNPYLRRVIFDKSHIKNKLRRLSLFTMEYNQVLDQYCDQRLEKRLCRCRVNFYRREGIVEDVHRAFRRLRDLDQSFSGTTIQLQFESSVSRCWRDDNQFRSWNTSRRFNPMHEETHILLKIYSNIWPFIL